MVESRKEMNLFISKTFCQNLYEIYHPIREIYSNLEEEIETQFESLLSRSTLHVGETFRDKIIVQQIDRHSFEFTYGSGINKRIIGMI